MACWLPQYSAHCPRQLPGSLALFQFQAVNAGECGFAWSGASVKDPQARNLPASFLTAPVAVEP